MRYEILGETLPVVICHLESGEKMVTEGGGMSWMSPNMKMETTSNGGIGKIFGRAFSGEKMFQNVYTAQGGEGMIAFASCFPGSIKAFEIAPEKSLLIGKALKILAEKAGIYGMIGGQVVEVASCGVGLDEGMLNFIYELKTGALIESSMMIGALLAGAEDAELEKVQKIASDVGIAFQIQDDILDVTSTTEELGKPVHSDEKNEKTTYVTLKGLEKATRDVEVISQEALELLSGLDRENAYLTQLIRELIHRKK